MREKRKVWISVACVMVIVLVLGMFGENPSTAWAAWEEVAATEQVVLTAEPVVEATAEVTTGPAMEATVEATTSPAIEATAQATTSPAIEATAEPTTGPVIEATVKPTPVPVTLTWKSKKSKLKAGKKYTFKVTVTGEKNVKATDIKWSVSNTKYASISKSGVFKGKRVGKVTVKAKYAGKTISCKVKVTAKKLIGIDPGHQAKANAGLEPVGPGATTKKPKVAGGTRGVATKLPEYKLTLQVAKKLKSKLESKGYGVVMTRTKNDVNITNKERAELLNEKGVDIAIRIHGDGGAASARGASMLYPSKKNKYVGQLSSKSYKLSKAIIGKYCKATGIKSRGCVKRDDLTGTNWSKVPVTLIELGFMTNATEDRYMSSDKGQKEMVKGIADGIDSYFGY